ncbi:hypothetical protein ACFLWY_01440 [Chloroflexota bacterium]
MPQAATLYVVVTFWLVVAGRRSYPQATSVFSLPGLSRWVAGLL